MDGVLVIHITEFESIVRSVLNHFDYTFFETAGIGGTVFTVMNLSVNQMLHLAVQVGRFAISTSIKEISYIRS